MINPFPPISMTKLFSLTPRAMPFSRRSRHHPISCGEEGFTLVLTLLTLLITSALLVAAFTAANGEVHLTSTDTAQKKAYYAAEAGIENYEYHLTEDGNYLTFCTNPTPANPALNEVDHTNHRATVPPGSSGEPTHEQYAIQLLPAESSKIKECNPNKIVETMIEEQGSATGSFRIESTGYSGGAEKTLTATFKNANFVSYVWYTKYETGDPVIYGKPPEGNEKYFSECGNFYNEGKAGGRPEQGGSPLRCLNNYFIKGESVNGPLHTGDHGGVCGSPTFGRNEHDRIEFGNGGKVTTEGYSKEGCSEAANPEFKGKYIPPKEVLSIEPPPGDEELKHIVEPEYLYTGKTEIVLEGEEMSVSKWTKIGETWVKETKSNVKYPPNGVIYVAGSCEAAYSPFGPTPGYTEDYSCGNAYVHGKYTASLTIAAENDLIINGNVLTPTEPEDSPTGTPKTNALLGLIANNFVRIFHPVIRTYEGHGPELETIHGEFESAGHKETIRAEAQGALANELKIEVKNAGTKFKMVVRNGKSEILEETEREKANELLLVKSPYVIYSEGRKYAEGAMERLKETGFESLGHAEIIKAEPKLPSLGKNLQVEVVEEEGSKSKLVIKNEVGTIIQTIGPYKFAKEFVGVSSSFLTLSKGAKYTEGENEKLKASTGKWLDEKCNKTENDKFSSSSAVRECEYTDEASQCDAPNKTTEDLVEPIIYAGILAVKHAVIVDNFSCGLANLDQLNVYGAVAGLYTNGFTGEFGSKGIEHGYPYDANYDNRLQAEEPPHFLNPIEAAWYIQRQTLAPNP